MAVSLDLPLTVLSWATGRRILTFPEAMLGHWKHVTQPSRSCYEGTLQTDIAFYYFHACYWPCKLGLKCLVTRKGNPLQSSGNFICVEHYHIYDILKQILNIKKNVIWFYMPCYHFVYFCPFNWENNTIWQLDVYNKNSSTLNDDAIKATVNRDASNNQTTRSGRQSTLNADASVLWPEESSWRR